MTQASVALPAHLPLTERRCFPRFAVVLAGCCSVNLGPDAACDSIDLSIAGIALRTPAVANIGDTVIASFREFGMAKGRVVRRFEGGFAFVLDNVDPYRSRLSQFLAWMVGGLERQADAIRVEERIVPLNRLLLLTRIDGRRHIGRVENVSRSGLFFTSTAAFEIGEAVKVGRHDARIVRVLDEGVAAEFESAIVTERFDVMISFAHSA